MAEVEAYVDIALVFAVLLGLAFIALALLTPELHLG